MGKERRRIISDDFGHKFSPRTQNENNNEDKSASAESFGSITPGRNHFYSERFAKPSIVFKRGEQVGKSKDDCLQLSNETFQYPTNGVSNIYIEAKKYLSEMLRNGDVNAKPMSCHLPISLGKILSLPEYNSSPCCSPRKHGDEIFMNAHMRLSPHGTVKNNANGLAHENHANHLSPVRQNYEIQLHYLADKVQSLNVPIGNDKKDSSEIQPCMECIINPEDNSSSSTLLEVGDMHKSLPDREGKIVNDICESSCNTIEIDIQNGDIKEVDSQESSFQCLEDSHQGSKSDLFEDDQIPSSPTLSPTRSSGTLEAKDSEDAISMDRPSPTSVLDPLFTDDDINPASTSTPVEKEIQPLKIHFEDQSPGCTRLSLKDEESAFEYVEAVLLGSGLNWDEFLSRWLSLLEILDPPLFDEVELFSSRPRHDQKLLFDCANEVLKEMCESYFGFFARISHVSLNSQPVPKGMDLIHEVYKRVEWHLLQHPLPHSLDQLAKSDMQKCGKWMNIQSDVELIGFDMEETIYDELVEETVLNFVNDFTSDCASVKCLQLGDTNL